MRIAAAFFQLVLWIWFFGCTVTYRTGRVLLVEGMGVKSAEFAVLCLYTAALACFYLAGFGKWVLAGLLALWLAVQFLCHWRYTIFGADERKLKGYNECFRGTARIFPENDERLVPDLYHIVLHALLAVNLILAAAA